MAEVLTSWQDDEIKIMAQELGVADDLIETFIESVRALADTYRPKRLAGSSEIMGVVVDWEDGDKFITVSIDDAAIRLFPEEAGQLARNINDARRYFEETSIQ